MTNAIRALNVAAIALAAALGLAHAEPAAPNRLFPDDRINVGDRISVEVVGHGPDVVLIPGLASSRETWRRTAERLRAKYRLHIVQVNGFAGAPAGANATGPVVAPTAEAIDAYIRSAGLKHPAVVGHSLGGVMALDLALDHPNDVGKVMVVDTLAFYTELFAGPAATVEGARPYADQIGAGMLKAPDEAFNANAAKMAQGMVTAPADAERIGGWSAASDRAVMVKAMQEDMLADLRPRMAELSVPLTVIYEAPLAELFAADYAPVKTKTLVAAAPGAKHFIMYDDPAGFDAALDGFLAR
jgi:pimeloyl-ACP methyl ester carboxylesterase